MDNVNSYAFERLEVFSKSRNLVVSIYKMTGTFPTSEQFGLQSQIRRAAVSIVLNIAEGSSRFSNKEKIRFFEVAYGSAIEVLAAGLLCKDLSYFSEEQELEVRSQVSDISKMLSGLKNRYFDNSNRANDADPPLYIIDS